MTAQTITVSNAAELQQALASATGGETILLAAGDYGRLDLRDEKYGSTVTIKSADPDAMASFSQMSLINSSNITFDTILFDYTYSSGDYHFQSPFGVNGSTDITFKDSVFDGDVAQGTGTSIDGTGYGTGLNILYSNNINIVGTEFKEWWKGLIAANSDTVSVTQSDIHTIRSDGLVFDNVDNILVEQNYIHDFGGAAGSGDHRDMIQIQRAYGSGSDNITIRDNVFDMGNGDYAQTIWMGGDGKDFSDPNVTHHNVVIEGNLIYNGHVNGIAVHGVDGLVISKNTVLHVDEKTLTGGVEIPAINVLAGDNVTIEQNITSQIIGHHGQSDWTVKDNVLLQPGEYDQAFDYLATAQSDGYNQYGTKAGSLADTLNAGSDLANGFPFSYASWVGAATSTNTGSNTNTGGSTGTAPDTNTGGNTGTTPDTSTGGNTGTAPDTSTGGDTGTTPDTNTGGDTDTTPDTNTGGDTDTTPDTDTSGDTDTTPDTDTGGDTDTTPDTDTGGDTDTTPDTDTGGDTDTTPDTDTGGDTDTTPDTDTGGDTDTTPDTDTGGDTDTTPDTDTGGDTDTTPDTDTGGDTDTTPDTDIGGDRETAPAISADDDTGTTPDTDDGTDATISGRPTKAEFIFEVARLLNGGSGYGRDKQSTRDDDSGGFEFKFRSKYIDVEESSQSQESDTFSLFSWRNERMDSQEDTADSGSGTFSATPTLFFGEQTSWGDDLFG